MTDPQGMTPEQAHDSIAHRCHFGPACTILVRLREIAAAAEARGRENGLPLLNELIAVLQEHVGQRGQSEGAVEVLQRIIRERDEAEARGRAACAATHAALIEADRKKLALNTYGRVYKVKDHCCIKAVQETLDHLTGLTNPGDAIAALEQAAERRGEERVRRVFVYARGDGWVVPNSIEGPVHPDTVTAEVWWALTGEGERPEEKG